MDHSHPTEVGLPVLVGLDRGALLEETAAAFLSLGHSVEQCPDRGKLLENARQKTYQLILLGAEATSSLWQSLLKGLRRYQTAPVIFISDSAITCVEALAAGADDFVLTPVNREELLARAQALLKKMGGATRGESDLCLGPLRLVRSESAARFDGRRLTLTAVQFRLLWCLAQGHGRVLTKPYLHKTVLEKDYCREDRSIDMHMSRIRRKLIAAGMMPDALQTVRGRGYRLSFLPATAPMAAAGDTEM